MRDLSLEKFLRTAIAENDRYMEDFDPRLLRPRVIPALARAALGVSNVVFLRAGEAPQPLDDRYGPPPGGPMGTRIAIMMRIMPGSFMSPALIVPCMPLIPPGGPPLPPTAAHGLHLLHHGLVRGSGSLVFPPERAPHRVGPPRLLTSGAVDVAN